ncbi:hypothetical protein K437DRAFT_125180 [Tilletiaria anomala UBC 951]|uniref:Uncharacterized protein n=1 Tax=Tilletiaria anomala (strain ATCC 24038 / CBS 436.72 / UBC 951) TaxID=1037660 RepID=A0A066W1V9_TILAU|nr:uncharacterized protein K437DRAFT_125180 [Tilletiaria anomala UBC 951]KDN45064.1 hypothetical protein K437DRAFT_125180 [Tilletiaria anomala UBC 951]
MHFNWNVLPPTWGHQEHNLRPCSLPARLPTLSPLVPHPANALALLRSANLFRDDALDQCAAQQHRRHVHFDRQQQLVPFPVGVKVTKASWRVRPLGQNQLGAEGPFFISKQLHDVGYALSDGHGAILSDYTRLLATPCYLAKSRCGVVLVVKDGLEYVTMHSAPPRHGPCHRHTHQRITSYQSCSSMLCAHVWCSDLYESSH